jgi:hypothetical protein
VGRGIAFLLFAGFGLAPLWASTLIVVMGSRGASSEYWNAAPWLMVMSIPVCAVTLVIAAVARVIAVRTRSNTVPVAVLLGGLAASVAVVLNFLPQNTREVSLEEERRLVQYFVATHPDVVRRLPAAGSTRVESTSMRWGKPKSYEVRSFFHRTAVLARVSVSRPDGQPRFELECLTTDAEIRKLGRNRCDD